MDKPAVAQIGTTLRALGIDTFLDMAHLRGGQTWLSQIEREIETSGAFATFHGHHGTGRWQDREIEMALLRAIEEDANVRIVPVLLPGTDRSTLSTSLRTFPYISLPTIDDHGAMEQLVAAIQGQPFGEESLELADELCPYVGLNVFTQHDRHRFMGREAETAAILERLSVASLALLKGPSGSGKSSILGAGLLPRVNQLAPRRTNGWVGISIVADQQPLRTLAAALLEVDPRVDHRSASATDELHDAFRDDPHHLARYMEALQLHSGVGHLLAIDQVERLATMARAPTDWVTTAEHFIKSLRIASERSQGHTKVVLVLRSDFTATLGSVEGFKELDETAITLAPLGNTALESAITDPARDLGNGDRLFFEAGLVEEILSDAADMPGRMPLVQHVLEVLWAERSGVWLTRDAYHRVGRVSGALETRANALFDSLPAKQQDVARQVFLRLTALGKEGRPDTIRVAPRAELLSAGGERARAALDLFSGETGRLIVVDEESAQFAHDQIFRSWRRLQDWIGADRSALSALRRLTDAATEWSEIHDKDSSALYRGVQLARALELRAESHILLSGHETEFVEAGVDHEAHIAHEKEKQNRRLRRGFAIATIAALTAAVAAAFALLWFAEARAESERANLEAETAVAAKAEADKQAAIAEENAARAEEQRAIASAEAERAKFAALSELVASAQLVSAGNPALGYALAAAAATTNPARSDPQLVLSELGHRLLGNHWQPVGPTVATSETSVRRTRGAPDGSFIATGGDSGIIQLWDRQTLRERGILELSDHGEINDLAISQVDNLVAAASNDGVVTIWNAKSDRVQPLLAHRHQAHALAWSPDGSWLATSGTDENRGEASVRIWRQGETEPVATLEHSNWVFGLAFSADSNTLVTGDHDGAIRAFDVLSGTLVNELNEATGSSIYAIDRSTSGDYFALGTASGGVELWMTNTLLRPAVESEDLYDLNSGGPIVSGGGGQPPVAQAAWAQRDVHPEGVFGITFSPEGDMLLSVGADRIMRAWRVETGGVIDEPWLLDDRIWSVDFLRDGTAAFAGDDAELRIIRPPTVDEYIANVGSPVQKVAISSTRKRSCSRKQWWRATILAQF